MIGGGVIGLSIARALHRAGVRDITVLEKGNCCREASWAAAGMLSPQAETDDFGPFFELCSASRDRYPAFAGQLLDETGVDIELERQGTFYLAFNDDDRREVLRRYERQREAGLVVDVLSPEDVLRAEPFISTSVLGGISMPNDWQVENRKLCEALIRYARLKKIKVLENTRATGIQVRSGRVQGVETADGPMLSDQVIVASGAWSSLIDIGDAKLPFDVGPVRGQMLGFKLDQRKFRHVIYTPRGYLVPRRDGRVLAGSTSEHVGFAKEVTPDGRSCLTEMAGEIAPVMSHAAISDSWSGLRPFASDGLPVLGPFEGVDGLFIATGHYRNGILLAPLTADLMARAVSENVDSPFFTTFGVTRLLPRSARAA